MTPRIGSLFTGYGGLDMAAQAVTGGQVVWTSDIQEHDKNGALIGDAPRIIAHRHPDVPNHGDITRINWRGVEPVEVLCGGSPCQDISSAGRMAGLTEGSRSNLWLTMLAAVAVLRPRLVLWENVRASLSTRADSALESDPRRVGDRHPEPVLRVLGRVLGGLADIGYDAQWICLPASAVGACHRRERVFLVACPQGDPWRVSNGDGGAAADPNSVRRARTGAPRGGRLGPADGGVRDVALLPTPKTTDAKMPGPADTRRNQPGLRALPYLLPTPRATDGSHGGPNQRGSKGDLMLPSAVRLLPTPSAADALGGHERRSGARGDELLLGGLVKTPDMWGIYAAAIARHETMLGRLAPAPTEPGRKGPRLSPRFVEWMMCLPDGWVTDIPGLPRNRQLRALGNGVVPIQAATAYRHLLGIEMGAAA